MDSGRTSSGNVIGNTVFGVGSMPPQTGMLVYSNRFPATGVYLAQITEIYDDGLILVGLSGVNSVTYASSGAPATDQLMNRRNPADVYVWASDAAAFGWPTVTGCVTMFTNSSVPSGFGSTTSPGPVRGVSGPGGTGLIYG